MKRAGFFILGFALLLYGIFLVYERNTPVLESKNSTSPNAKSFSVFFPTLAQRLPIIPSIIENGKWQTTSKGVSYLSTSPAPGARGNSVLYGHNWPNLLGNLGKLNPGDPIIIYTKGQAIRFTVYFKTVVGPKDTSVLADTRDYRLTIYTCTGFLDSKRIVITALADLPITDASASY